MLFICYSTYLLHQQLLCLSGKRSILFNNLFKLLFCFAVFALPEQTECVQPLLFVALHFQNLYLFFCLWLFLVDNACQVFEYTVGLAELTGKQQLIGILKLNVHRIVASRNIDLGVAHSLCKRIVRPSGLVDVQTEH